MSGEGEDATYEPDAVSGDTYAPTAGVPDYQPTHLWASDSKNSGAKNQAKVARAEWDDYKTRFQPIENELIGQIGDPGVYRDNVTRATDSVNDSFNTGAGELQRNMQRYGVTQTPAEAQQNARQYGLTKASATAEAANRTRSAVKNRNMQILGGGLSPTDLRKSTN